MQLNGPPRILQIIFILILIYIIPTLFTVRICSNLAVLGLGLVIYMRAHWSKECERSSVTSSWFKQGKKN